jgi:hypothetical protein
MAVQFPLADARAFPETVSMSIDFGWWNKDADGRKYQVNATVHGGNIAWRRKQGHHAAWESHTPDDDDRARLVAEASRRLPRRLISQRQFEEIKRLSSNLGPGGIVGRRMRVSPEL